MLLTDDQQKDLCMALVSSFPETIVRDLYPCYVGQANERETRLADAYKATYPPAIVIAMFLYYESVASKM